MQSQNIEVASQVINHLSGELRGNAPFRILQVLFRLAQHGPETVAEIAKALEVPQSAVMEDLTALRRSSSNSKVFYNLVQEIQPVTKGKPSCYRLSKRADKMMDDLDYRMQVYALPEDDAAPSLAVGFDDDLDEPLGDWEASRDLVRG